MCGYTMTIKNRSLRTDSQIDSWTIFSRAETRSRMKIYHILEKQT